MTLNTLTTTTMLLGTATALIALYFLVSEIDRFSHRPKPVHACRYSRRTTLMVGWVLNRNAVRINGQTWDLPQPLSVNRGQRVSLVLEA